MESEAEKLRSALEKDTFDEEVTKIQVKPTDRTGREGFTLIHWACYYGRVKALQHFLTVVKAADLVSVVDTHGWTPSHVCAIKGHTDCLKLLIENGANMILKDHRGYTCGHCAAIHGNTSVLQCILDAGHDANIKDSRQWTVVHHAAFYGRHQTLQMLALKGCDLLSPDGRGNIPAHLSASEGHLECLRLVVYFNHTPSLVLAARNNKGATPKDLSIQFQKSACADFLSLAGKELSRDVEDIAEDYPAHHAADIGDLQALTSLIQDDQFDINARDMTGSTPAHKAAGNGHLSCLQWLIDNGANLSIINNLKESPLDVAKKYGKTQCVILIEEEQAKLKINELEKMLSMSKDAYLAMGGDLDECQHEKQIKELTERHAMEVCDLEGKLQLEREKREMLEREADMLRLQLHQANDSLLHYKTLLLSSSQNDQQVLDDNKNKSIQSTNKPRRRTLSASTAASRHKRTGGAYIDLRPK